MTCFISLDRSSMSGKNKLIKRKLRSTSATPSSAKKKKEDGKKEDGKKKDGKVKKKTEKNEEVKLENSLLYLEKASDLPPTRRKLNPWLSNVQTEMAKFIDGRVNSKFFKINKT